MRRKQIISSLTLTCARDESAGLKTHEDAPAMSQSTRTMESPGDAAVPFFASAHRPLCEAHRICTCKHIHVRVQRGWSVVTGVQPLVRRSEHSTGEYLVCDIKGISIPIKIKVDILTHTHTHTHTHINVPPGSADVLAP